MPTEDGVSRSIEAWLERSVADARHRGLPELEPLLQGLAASTMALRRADWNLGLPERRAAPPAPREPRR